MKYALLTFSLSVLTNLPLALLLHLCAAGFTLGPLLLAAVLAHCAHLLHLLTTLLAFGSLLLAAILTLHPPGLTLLRLLSVLLPAGVHLVHALLATGFILLAHLLHHLLALLAAILVLWPLPFGTLAATAAPIRTLRGTGLAHLPSSSSAAAVSAFLTLDLRLAAAAAPLGRRSASVSLAIPTTAASAFALAESIRLCADHDRERGERGENEFI